MYPILFHPLVLVNMLGAEGMVLAQDDTDAQQDHRCRQHAYCQQYRFHPTSAFTFFCAAFCNLMQK